MAEHVWVLKRLGLIHVEARNYDNIGISMSMALADLEDGLLRMTEYPFVSPGYLWNIRLRREQKWKRKASLLLVPERMVRL